MEQVSDSTARHSLYAAISAWADLFSGGADGGQDDKKVTKTLTGPMISAAPEKASPFFRIGYRFLGSVTLLSPLFGMGMQAITKPLA